MFLIFKKIRKIPKILLNISKNLKAFISSRNEIKKLKNKYKDQRCFIIGNGPSLMVEDLEKIKQEKSFSSHRIYKIFDSTNWRPDFYCVQDYQLVIASENEISKMPECSKAMMGRFIRLGYPSFKGFLSFRINNKKFYPDLPLFSEDVSKCIYQGMTVSYMCLQLAIYMGFKEIYLLGIDHSYSVTLNENGEITHHSGVKDHFSEEDNIANVPVLYMSTLSYVAAKEYAEKKGVKIYNATRGGDLEVFERVDFDSISFQ